MVDQVNRNVTIFMYDIFAPSVDIQEGGLAPEGWRQRVSATIGVACARRWRGTEAVPAVCRGGSEGGILTHPALPAGSMMMTEAWNDGAEAHPHVTYTRRIVKPEEAARVRRRPAPMHPPPPAQRLFASDLGVFGLIESR